MRVSTGYSLGIGRTHLINPEACKDETQKFCMCLANPWQQES